MTVDHIQFFTWVLGAIGAIAVFMFGLWWKIESRQDQKIDESAKQNGKEHKDLHAKIDSNHHSIRDRLENIWQHISKRDD
jgi:hypothetical protein